MSGSWGHGGVEDQIDFDAARMFKDRDRLGPDRVDDELEAGDFV